MDMEYRVTFADGQPAEWRPIPADPFLMFPTSPATPPAYIVAKIEFREPPKEEPAKPRPLKIATAKVIIEAMMEVARHGSEPGDSARDWARGVLDEIGVPYYPAEPVTIEPPAEFELCRFPACDCNMNVPTPYHCEEYRGR